jgi:hypothetical protein
VIRWSGTRIKFHLIDQLINLDGRGGFKGGQAGAPLQLIFFKIIIICLFKVYGHYCPYKFKLNQPV